MNIGALIFRRPHQINVVRKIEDDSNSTTTMCECPFFSEVNLIADYLCTFKDRLESLVCDTNCVTRHHNFRIFKSLFLEDIQTNCQPLGVSKSCLYGLKKKRVMLICDLCKTVLNTLLSFYNLSNKHTPPPPKKKI